MGKAKTGENSKKRAKKSRRIEMAPAPEVNEADILRKDTERLLEKKAELTNIFENLPQKTYRAVAINKQAKELWAEIQQTRIRLQERIDAIDKQLDLQEKSIPRSVVDNLRIRNQWIQERNNILHQEINTLTRQHENLAAIEEDLFPKTINANAFLDKKKAAAELYVSLKNRISKIEVTLNRYDDSIKEALQKDIAQLKNQLQEVSASADKIKEVSVQSSRTGVITADMYAQLANVLYEVNEKAFAVIQNCQLLEERLGLVMQDQVIEKEVANLAQTYEILKGAYYQLTADSQHGELFENLKDLLMDENSRFKLSFSVDSFKPSIPITDLHWSDDASQRARIKAEREQLLLQLNEKGKEVETIVKTIVAYQKNLKEAISDDLEFCLQRAGLEAAFEKRNSLPYYSRIKAAINFNFQANVNDPTFVTHLQTLLLNISAGRTIKLHRRDLEKHQEQFLHDFPAITLTDDSFIYQKKKYPRQSALAKKLEEYHIAQQRIATAFADGDGKTSYASIDYKAELAKLQESKEAIEQFTVTYEGEQDKKAQELQILQKQLNNYSLIPTENNAYASTQYPLPTSIRQAINNYNSKLDKLTATLNTANSSNITETDLTQLQSEFKALRENKKEIEKLFAEQQTLINELESLTEKLVKHEQLLDSKINLATKIYKQIETEVQRIQEKNPEDSRINFLTELESPFFEVKKTLTELKDDIGSFQNSKNTLALENRIETAKTLLSKVIEENKTTTKKLGQHVDEQFSSANLSKLSNSTPILEELFQFIKTLIPSLYKLLKGDEKLSKPGFFSSKAEKNLHSFSKDLLPDIEAIKEQQGAAPAA
ncbi:hypothetical protein A8135_06905 [Legionella jamestowniensis]|uniref:Uncharacterized protein n=1 Tax=Legionella jamestowniensis TaxID=455 RepID=A0ABX2Y573_9GAMM|nr:hypothetical protein [Legionella jamestowniensis]OCH99410.1 hypothetical protein A8135_06905 [Legionella jamestowniensis]